MYIKVTRSGPRRYVQLVEAYRDDAGKARHRTLATLGRLEDVAGQVDSVINGLLRVSGREAASTEGPEVAFTSARAFGDVWALDALWHQLGLDDLKGALRGRQHFDAERLLRILVFNRLCDPDSKLGVLRWLETVAFPDGDTEDVTHQQLLRAMDLLEARQEALETRLAQRLYPILDEDLSVVFYDLTTITVTGSSEEADELRAYGRSKDGGTARQVMLGVVQTADGLPIAHEVLAGNTAEGATLMPMLERLVARYPIKRIVLVADRGLLSLENLEALDTLRLPSGAPLEYLLAVPASRYGDFEDLLAPLASADAADWTRTTHWQGRRLIVDHRAARAEAATQARRERIRALEQQAAEWAGKLDTQDQGARYRGRRLSDSGAKARFYHAVKEARLAHVIRVEMPQERFSYHIDQARLDRLEALDGKLLLVTNVTDRAPEELVDRYHALADIERGFRVLKSELAIGPMHHRLPQRIRAHALICFLALVLYRVMRLRLRAAGQTTSPERTLAAFRKIQKHRITLNRSRVVSGLSTMATEQLDLFSALSVPRPTSTANARL